MFAIRDVDLFSIIATIDKFLCIHAFIYYYPTVNFVFKESQPKSGFGEKGSYLLAVSSIY